MFAAIFAVVGWLSSIVTSMVALGVAIKFLLIFLFTLVLPFVLQWMIIRFSLLLLDLATRYFPNFNAYSLTYQFTGLGAYIADHMQLALCLSIVLSSLATRFVLRSVRIL